MTKPRRQVALIVETSIAYGRRILRGITRYLRSHGPWSVRFEQRELGAYPDWIRNWRGDGVICRATRPDLVAALRKTGVPVVDLNDRTDDREFALPRIRSDDQAIGRLAAEHLLERGFLQFAYCGFAGEDWSQQRAEGFFAAIGRRTPGDCFATPWEGTLAHPWDREQKELTDWLQSLPRPLGLMACNDMRGQHLLDLCQQLAISVPEEAAVVGVDNDELLCELCQPPLSSVAPNAERVGYEAAALLDSLMRGEQPEWQTRAIEPLGVVTRLSSDVLAIDDPEIAAAVRFIRENACLGATVADVLKVASLSRSLVERKFRQYLGRSPQAEIRHVQLKRVKELLAETDLPLQQVAELAGYKHTEYLSVVFRRETGQTPGQYRRSVRAEG